MGTVNQMPNTRHQRNFVKTLARGLVVMRAFTPERPQLTLTELSENLGLDPGTTSRFVYTLEHLGYLRRDPVSRAYRPTSLVLELGRAVHTQDELLAVARPFMEELSFSTQETVMLAVRDGPDILMVDEVVSRQTVMARGWVGERYPTYCTAPGKVLLAYLPHRERERLIDQMRLQALGPTTITDRADLRAELDRVARQGYAVTNDEMNAGLYALAGPLRSAAGAVTATLSLGVPTNRMTLAELIQNFRDPVLTTCDRICAALSGAPST